MFVESEVDGPDSRNRLPERVVGPVGVRCWHIGGFGLGVKKHRFSDCDLRNLSSVDDGAETF